MTREVLEEVEVDHRSLRSTDLFGVELEEATQVIVLCEPEELPRLPKRLTLEYWGIPDPLCAPREEQYEEFLACRDTLFSRIRTWLRSQEELPLL
jgi:protein-tyrosine-phosphatase